MDILITTDTEYLSQSGGQCVIVDALIGYGLDGELRPPADGMIGPINGLSESVVSLDVPSGIDATTGEALGVAVSEPSHSHSQRPGSKRSLGRCI